MPLCETKRLARLLMLKKFSWIRDGAWTVNNQNKNLVIYFRFKFYHNFEFSSNFVYYFYLGCMDSSRMSLWWTQFEWCLCIIVTSSQIDMSPRPRRRHKNTIKIME
jgi:hypothetical protein